MAGEVMAMTTAPITLGSALPGAGEDPEEATVILGAVVLVEVRTSSGEVEVEAAQ